MSKCDEERPLLAEQRSVGSAGVYGGIDTITLPPCVGPRFPLRFVTNCALDPLPSFTDIFSLCFFGVFVALRGELAQLPPDRVGIQMEGSVASHERTELTGD